MKIFEIKVYPFSEKEFENRKNKFINKYEDKNKKYPFARNDYLFKIFYADKLTFENYCIGYVELYVEEDRIRYEVKIMLRRKYPSKKALQEEMDKLDDNEYPTYDMKENKVKELASYKLVPYKPKLLTEKKHYMVNDYISENITDIRELDNKQILNAIRTKIMDISKTPNYKNLYFDMSMFNIIAEYIDFKKISRDDKEVNLNRLFKL